MSAAVPSPQLTTRLVTVIGLEIVKTILTGWLVLAGFGVVLMIVTLGSKLATKVSLLADTGLPVVSFTVNVTA
jgi:hypothetical protein